MASRDFGLVKYEFKRVDGKGEVITAYQTPSALIRATKADQGDPVEAGMLMAFYCAQSAGVVGKTGVKFAKGSSDIDRAYAFFDVYQFREVPLDDDGNEAVTGDGDGDPDPTGPRRRASAS